MPPHQRLPSDDPRATLVRRLQAAWNRGDLDAVMAGHHPDAVYVMVGGLESLVGSEFHGRDAIRAFFEDFQGSFGELQIDTIAAQLEGPIPSIVGAYSFSSARD
jgi:uncharacterized protein (TIGR02246 family)